MGRNQVAHSRFAGFGICRSQLDFPIARLNRFLAIINSNRLETHGIPSTLSLIKSKEILSIGISCYLPFLGISLWSWGLCDWGVVVIELAGG